MIAALAIIAGSYFVSSQVFQVVLRSLGYRVSPLRLWGIALVAIATIAIAEPLSAAPPTIERFPWAGHIGLKLLPQVVSAIERARSTLVFTNVRSQTEIWYQALLEARPEWAGLIGLHHGSLDTDVRRWVEEGLKEGRLKAVVSGRRIAPAEIARVELQLKRTAGPQSLYLGSLWLSATEPSYPVPARPLMATG